MLKIIALLFGTCFGIDNATGVTIDELLLGPFALLPFQTSPERARQKLISDGQQQQEEEQRYTYSNGRSGADPDDDDDLAVIGAFMSPFSISSILNSLFPVSQIMSSLNQQPPAAVLSNVDIQGDVCLVEIQLLGLAPNSTTHLDVYTNEESIAVKIRTVNNRQFAPPGGDKNSYLRTGFSSAFTSAYTVVKTFEVPPQCDASGDSNSAKGTYDSDTKTLKLKFAARNATKTSTTGLDEQLIVREALAVEKQAAPSLWRRMFQKASSKAAEIQRPVPLVAKDEF